MDWKLYATTFASVFVAELGDKTQLATFALAARPSARVIVFLGAASALICTSLLAVLAGGIAGQLVPEAYLKRGAGALFVLLGVWMIWRG